MVYRSHLKPPAAGILPTFQLSEAADADQQRSEAVHRADRLYYADYPRQRSSRSLAGVRREHSLQELVRRNVRFSLRLRSHGR